MMEWLCMGIFGGLALVFAGAALWFRRKKQRLYREVDRMMDRILDNKKIEQTDLSEGRCLPLRGRRGVSRKNWRLKWAVPRGRRSR